MCFLPYSGMRRLEWIRFSQSIGVKGEEVSGDPDSPSSLINRLMASNLRDWDLVFILPNLSLKPKTRFVASKYSICSLQDWRVARRLRNESYNALAKQLARRYRTVWARRYTPSVLIARRELPDKHNAADLRNFRNICALCTVILATARSLLGGQWLPVWSDFFAFGRFTTGATGIQSLDGSSKGFWDEDDLKKFRGTTAEVVDNPEHFIVDREDYDQVLFQRFAKVLNDPSRLSDVDRGKLFRSLSMAFHAARYPSDGLNESYDFGVRLALWVGSFEALLNPRTRDVNKSDVLRFLETISWLKEELAPLRYPERSRAGRRIANTCYAGAIYQILYTARSLFLHGSEADRRALVFRGRNLLMVAPVIYGLALHQYLRSATDPVDDVSDYFFSQGTLEDALIASKRRRTEN
jgi:hypothetical protein